MLNPRVPILLKKMFQRRLKEIDGCDKAASDESVKLDLACICACLRRTTCEVEFNTALNQTELSKKERDENVMCNKETIKATYDKIYSAQSVLPCSNMPRFGVTGFLTPDQIRDYVAMLLDPNRPVNK